MKKKKLLIGAALVLIVGIGGFIGIKEYTKPTNNQEQNQEETLNRDVQGERVGDTFIYNDSMRAYLSETGYDKAEKYEKLYGLEDGVSLSEHVFNKEVEDTQFWLDDGFYTDEYFNENGYYDTEGVALEQCESALQYANATQGMNTSYKSKSKLVFSDVFNEDLSLKNPEMFTGTTTVDIRNHRYYENNKENRQEWYDNFVDALKYLDETHKDEEDGETLKRLLMKFQGEGQMPFLSADSYSEYVGGNYIWGKKWNDAEDLTPMNWLQLFLSGRNDIYHFGKDLKFYLKYYNKEIEEKELLPEEYNYFKDDTTYEVSFYPTKVTKVDDQHYLITLEVDKPIDALTTGCINGLMWNVFVGSWYADAVVENENLDISIEITYKDLSSGMITEYSIFSIINGGHLIDSHLKWQENSPFAKLHDCLWYPNEEAQKWVQEYFSVARQAYDENSRFSIFETIENVAQNNNAKYEDVESVILSYYYIHNFMYH